MGATFTPVFNRTNTRNKNGLYSIHIRVTIDRQTRYFNPDLPRLRPEYWLKKPKPNKWVKDTHPRHFEINRALRKELDDLEEYYTILKATRIPVTFNKIKSQFDRKGNKDSFNDYVDHYLKTTKFKAVNTRKKYATFRKHLQEFNPKLSFHHLEEQLFHEFRDFLLAKGHKGSTVIKYFNPFKRIVRSAVRNHFLL